MRALQLESFGRIVVVDLPEPEAAAGTVVIETIATGICGSDIHGYTGDNGRRIPGQVMGHETVGRIVALGEGVDADRLPIGALVTVNPVFLGDTVRVLPSGIEAWVARLLDGSSEVPSAPAGRSVAVVLDRPVDVSRGDLLVDPARPPEVADQFEAHLVWMSDSPLLPGRAYDLKIGAAVVPARVTALKHRVDVDTGEALAARTLGRNDIGLATLSLDAPVPFEPYAASRDLGGFILIDRMTSGTAGAGMIRFALRRSANVRPQPLAVDRSARAALNGHRHNRRVRPHRHQKAAFLERQQLGGLAPRAFRKDQERVARANRFGAGFD